MIVRPPLLGKPWSDDSVLEELFDGAKSEGSLQSIPLGPQPLEALCGEFAGDMDEHSQGRRFSQNTLSDSQGTRYASLGSSASQNELLSDASAERYRHGQQQQLGLSSSARTLESSAGADGEYYSHPMSTFSGSTNLTATQMPYGPGYTPGGTDAAARQQQQQQTAGFGSYNASMMMYSVPQTSAQTSIYTTPQYTPSLSSRNNPMSSTPLLPDQSDVNPSYFGEAGVSPGTTSLEHTANSASTTAYYQDIPAPFHYAGGAAAESGGGSVSGTSALTGVESFYHLADPGGSSSAAMADTSGTDRTAEFVEKWQEYQRRLANLFQDIKNGNLERAAEGLLSVSFWLLSRVEELGLTEDDEDLHKDRLKLWQDFNHAWLALVFKQKQYMTRADPSMIVLQPLSIRTVKRMGDELVRLCDGIERHGLVDYQFGVWEDEIETC
ncbi:hypothetical protein BBO_03884 [Beauveria brongniartii RCEF 3172]|uniref:Uncharacterized protein n=1 Tax=Beauveria brongniartii RCEF 3172 TaxID=1081107 RepID=A0A167FIC7_9HYPO|nr:hypothetical protein BBO_03884 [Beauveria brongniartii RCEF 3172]